MLRDIAMFSRYAWGLRSFLRRPLALEQARAQVQRRLKARDKSFLRIVQRGVYAQPESPYRRLLLHAGIDFEDLAELVRKTGVESTLHTLHSAGVYLTLEEFKRQRTIVRGSLSIPVRKHDVDNPLPAGHYEASSGGSRSAGTRIVVDLDLLAYETAYHMLYQSMFGLEDRPMAVWRPLPPGSSGIKNALYQLKSGRRLHKWFHQNRQAWDGQSLKYRAFTAWTVYASRLAGHPLPAPQHVPPAQAHKVARWLAEMRIRGAPALLDGSATSAVRVCLEARRLGLDIRDTFFRVGGEPFTAAKAKTIREAGGIASPHYSMSEVGRIGIGCAAPSELDDMHIMLDKFAVIQRDRHIAGHVSPLSILHLTTLHPATPKLMLNVETDDYAVLVRRDCGCPLGELGLSLHAHSLRSFEKLSSEGMSFIGSDLISLVEEILP
ncbi:MAG: hypothetical protein ACREJC_21010, partial [Tepidisphaeraceae bacterium]